MFGIRGGELSALGTLDDFALMGGYEVNIKHSSEASWARKYKAKLIIISSLPFNDLLDPTNHSIYATLRGAGLIPNELLLCPLYAE
jgi:hypothetical protein